MGSWKKGWHLITHALRVFIAYPVFLVPIMLVWLAYAAGTLYLRYDFPWKQHGAGFDIGATFVCIFALSLLILLSFSAVLELIRQAEVGQPSLIRAIGTVIGRDLLSVLPLAIVWAVIWLALTLIEVVLSNSNKNNHDDAAFSAQQAAMTLADYHNFSLSAAFIDALQKGVRMVMFLILPATAWEHLGFLKGTKKGLAVLRAHLGLFSTGYVFTYAAGIAIFLPATIILMLGTGQHGNPPLIHFPDYVWVATIIYMGFAWSLSLYFEQMYMAQLYLWHMTWERAVAQATAAGQPIPAFKDVPQPELLTKTPALFDVAPPPA